MSAEDIGAGGDDAEASPTMTFRQQMEALQEAGVMSAEPYNLYDLFMIVSEGRALLRTDLINATTTLQEAIVLTGDSLHALLDQAGIDHFTMIDAHGRPIRIFRGCIPEGEELIILPDHLGDEEGRPRVRVTEES